jgi:hypothetical protein
MNNKSKNTTGKTPSTTEKSSKVQSNKQEVQNLQREQSSQQQFQNRDQHDRVNTDRDHSNKNFANRGNTDRDTSNDRFAHQGVSSRLGDHPEQKTSKPVDGEQKTSTPMEEEITLQSGVRTNDGSSNVTDEETTMRGNPTSQDYSDQSAARENRDLGFSSKQDRVREANEQGTDRRDDVMSPAFSGRKDFVGQTGQKFDGQIRPHMPVVCSNDKQFATIDHVEGRNLKLARDQNGQHHYIPLSWVRSVDDKVHIDRPGQEAMAQWSTSPEVMTTDSTGSQSQPGKSPNRH